MAEEVVVEGASIPVESLSADYQANPALATFIKDGKFDVGASLKSYLSAQELIGRKGIPAPKDENDAEGYNRVFDALGRPKTADEYKLPEAKDLKLPEGFPVDEGLIKGFRDTAHKMGILPSQAAGLYKWFMETQGVEYGNLQTGRQTARNEAETALRKELGKAYEPSVALAKKVLKENADEATFKALEEGIGNDPRLIKFLAGIGKKLGEDGLKGKGGNFTMSPEEAANEIKRINGEALKDPKHALNVKGHPEHELFVKKLADLNAMAYPEKA